MIIGRRLGAFLWGVFGGAIAFASLLESTDYEHIVGVLMAAASLMVMVMALLNRKLPMAIALVALGAVFFARSSQAFADHLPVQARLIVFVAWTWLGLLCLRDADWILRQRQHEEMRD